MKEIEIAYMAGVFDGEGSIIIGKSKQSTNRIGIGYQLLLSLGMADKSIPDLFCSTFGGFVFDIPAHRTEFVKNALKTQWIWRINSKKAMQCLEILIPYLRVKKDEARLAITFQTAKSIHGGIKGIRGHPPKTDEAWAIEENQYILMRSLKNKSEVYDGQM